MIRALSLLAALLLPAARAFAQEEVAVDAGAMTPELVRLLRFERPDLSFTSSTSTSAATRVSLKRDRELLSLAVVENGAPRIERMITVERERLKPALRVAALLVVEALAPEPPAIAPEPKSFRLMIGGAAGLWMEPLTPRLGFSIAGQTWIDELLLGLRVTSRLCCRVTTEALEGSISEVGFLADVAYPLAELGSARLSLAGAAGVNLAWFNGQAHFGPDADSPLQPLPVTAEGALRFGVALEVDPLVIAAGAHLRVGRMRVQLPELFREGRPPLDPGIASPFLELSTAFDVF